MKKLKYDQFVVQGGDWGSVIATQMALRHPQEVIGIHVKQKQRKKERMKDGKNLFLSNFLLICIDQYVDNSCT